MRTKTEYLTKAEALKYFDEHPDILAEIKYSLKNRTDISQKPWRLDALTAAIYCKMDERLIKHLISPLAMAGGFLFRTTERRNGFL